jgi:hypothetical protein
MVQRFSFVLITILMIAILLTSLGHITYKEQKIPENFYFGVSLSSNRTDEAIALIDKVKDYTNFLLINSWEISINETALDEVCSYAFKNDLSFIVFFDFISLDFIAGTEHGYPWHHQWVYSAKDRWGDKFLGIYIYEEPGGKQLDTGLFDELDHDEFRSRMYENVTTYSEAAEVFVSELPKSWSFHYLQNIDVNRYVSDYALYWFDYLAGYNTVFVELGWNQSTPKHIGLCRGAARIQEKDWGTIIVWKGVRDHENPNEGGTYKSGPEMYQDMLDSYQAGANYVIIFNFPKDPPNNIYGILKEEHFKAMEQFWEYANTFPEDFGKIKGDIVYVLPKDYAWGLRRVDDVIWLPNWGPDEFSLDIWEDLNKLIVKYGLRLDIIYDDPHFNIKNYDEIYYWNDEID